MANPPITVGELNDVPAPESPVNAQFHQEVANRIAHRFASVGAMNAWAAAAGSLAYTGGTIYLRVSGTWWALASLSAMQAADTTLQTNINNLANRPVTSAMIQDGTIVAADLAPSVLSSGWAVVDMVGGNWVGPSAVVKKTGNIVWYRMQASVGGIGTAAGTVPVGFRPTSTVYVPVVNVSNGTSLGASVTAAGVITMTGTSPSGHVLVASGHWESTP